MSPARTLRGLAVLLGLSATTANARGQAVDIPDFNTLATPPGPAWTLLGLEPSTVERPSNPTAFGLSVLQRTENLTMLPSDWAIELSPYWLFGRSDLEWEDDIERDALESIQRSLSISLVTAQTGDANRPVTSLGAAFRVSVLSGTVPAQAQQDAMRLRALLAGLARSEEEAAEAIRQSMHVEDSLIARRARDGQQLANEWLQAKLDSIEQLVQGDAALRTDLAARRKAAEEFQLNASVRHGFMLEVAGGWAADAPFSIADSLDARQWGLWVSPSWIGEAGSIIGVARYLSDPGVDQPEFAGAFDFGIRLMVQRPRFSLSAEGAMRTFQLADGVDASTAPQQGDWRLAGIAEYRVRQDLWLRATFGRDFDRVVDGGGLLAQIAFSVDIGMDRYNQN